MKIAITADWHIDNMRRTYLVDGKPNREIDLDRQINFMAETCASRNVDTLVIAGDLFERNTVSGFYFSKAVDYIRSFSDKGINVFILAGNHEVTEAGSSVTSALTKLRDDGIIIVERLDYWGYEDFVFLFVPHIRRKAFQEYKSFTEYIHEFITTVGKPFCAKRTVVVGHFQPANSNVGSEESMFSGSTRYVNCSVFGNSPVFCGHVHRPQTIGNVHVPGSIVRFTAMDEKDKKRFLIYDSNSGQVESVFLKCQPLQKVKLDLVSKSMCEFSKQNLSKFRGAMVCVEVSVSEETRKAVFRKDIVSAFSGVGAHVISFKLIKEEKSLRGGSVKEGDTLNMAPEFVLKRVIKQEVSNPSKRKTLFRAGKTLIEEALS